MTVRAPMSPHHGAPAPAPATHPRQLQHRHWGNKQEQYLFVNVTIRVNKDENHQVPENCPFVLTSPRSLEACRRAGVQVRIWSHWDCMTSRGSDEGPQSPQTRWYQLARDTTRDTTVPGPALLSPCLCWYKKLPTHSCVPAPAQGPGAAAKNWQSSADLGNWEPLACFLSISRSPGPRSASWPSS